MITPASLKHLPESWRQKPVFESGGRTFALSEVVQSAALRTELPSLIAESRARQCLEWQSMADGLEADMDAIGVLMDEFRYARNLESVEDTEHWLEQRGLGTDDLAGFCARSYWAATLKDSRPDPDLAPPDGAVETWPADLVFTGHFQRLASQLASEVSLGIGTPGPDPDAAAALIDRFLSQCCISPGDRGAWLEAWELDVVTAGRLLHWQDLSESLRREALNDTERSRLLVEQRANLVQVEIAVVRFDTEPAAKEAYLCVESDRMELEAVAQQAGYPIQRMVSFHHELPEALRIPILGARSGSTLPPQANNGTYDVYRVIRHREPKLEDPAVRAAVDGLLVRRRLGSSGLNPVRWIIQEDTPA